MDTKIVRIFNTYGPRRRLRDGRAVPAFMSQALRNEDVTVFGDGTQTRSLLYVTDLVDGILRLRTPTRHDPVNICTRTEVTIEQSRARSSRWSVRAAKSSTGRCRKTIRSSASQDITRARTYSAGSRRWDSRPGWRRPSVISSRS